MKAELQERLKRVLQAYNAALPEKRAAAVRKVLAKAVSKKDPLSADF
jgi:outer membrane protein OmpA-like peptidoglycan-associated protein